MMGRKAEKEEESRSFDIGVGRLVMSGWLGSSKVVLG